MHSLLKPIIIVLLITLSCSSFAGYHSHTYVYYGHDYPPPRYYGHEYYEYHYRPYHHHHYHSSMSHEDAGVISGGLVGGLLGSTIGHGNGQLLAIAAGGIAGALIGSSIGRDMDENDRMRMMHALEQNDLGQPAYWRNARSGVHYRVVPMRNVKIHGNPYCREYRTIADIGGKKQELYGTACRQVDGSWKIVS